MTQSKTPNIAVDVYRNNSIDCTRGGVTSQFDRLILFLDQPTEGELDELGDEPALLLKPASAGGLCHAVPVGKSISSRRPVMGGNFVYSFDSRFRAISQYPIPVHDRFEG